MEYKVINLSSQIYVNILTAPMVYTEQKKYTNKVKDANSINQSGLWFHYTYLK